MLLFNKIKQAFHATHSRFFSLFSLLLPCFLFKLAFLLWYQSNKHLRFPSSSLNFVLFKSVTMSTTETPSSSSLPSSNATALSSIDNPRNPYYLNNGDNPGISLVTEKLIGENFHTWQRSMTRALSTKNKLGFVNGSISQPIGPLDPLFDIWTRCNDLVLSWLTNCMSREIYASVIYAVTAREIWDELRDRYLNSDGPRVFHLKQAICSPKQNQLPVSTYCTRLKAFWDEFSNYRPIPNCTCGANCTCGLYKILTDYQHKDYV